MTSQEQADILLRQHQENRGRKMNLFDYDLNIKPHLNFIEAGASMAARHARLLVSRPEFRTKAQDELAETRKVLESALASINVAERAYEAKPLENDRAA